MGQATSVTPITAVDLWVIHILCMAITTTVVV
jgi:hypothetical protein